MIFQKTQLDLIRLTGREVTPLNQLTAGLGLAMTVWARDIIVIGVLEQFLAHAGSVDTTLATIQQEQLFTVRHLVPRTQDTMNPVVDGIGLATHV